KATDSPTWVGAPHHLTIDIVCLLSVNILTGP
ncbi:unnamed protein product, partial [marine sediment metagenome]